MAGSVTFCLDLRKFHCPTSILQMFSPGVLVTVLKALVRAMVAFSFWDTQQNLTNKNKQVSLLPRAEYEVQLCHEAQWVIWSQTEVFPHRVAVRIKWWGGGTHHVPERMHPSLWALSVAKIDRGGCLLVVPPPSEGQGMTQNRAFSVAAP